MSVISGCVPMSMPARLAFQPKPLRLSLQRASWSFPRNPFTGCRWYTSQGKTTPGQSFAYTWLTKTPDEIIPDDVLTSFPPTPASLTEAGNIPVLLVTPSFAPWVDPASHFLDQCMNRFLHHSPDIRSRSPFHAIAAVVDKLPDAREQSDGTLVNGHGQGPSESEGISLLFVKAEHIQGKAATPRRLKASGTDEPALVVSVDTCSDAPGDEMRRPVHEVGLRLASTIFVNGNEHTLFGLRWTYDSASARLALDQTIELSSCIITSTTDAVRNAFELPLYPVGQRRKVISGMGNILRQLAKSADDDKSDTPMPASSELEKDLPRYIEEHDIVDQRVSVWALVETPEMDVSNEAGFLQDRLSQSLRAGGKLHHVMSGGGGWGKKQGLLSLDPEVSFSEVADRGDLLALSQLFDPSANQDFTQGLPPFLAKAITGDDLSTLSQTARPGDYVQFFVSIERSQDARPNFAKPQEASTSYHFGVVAGTPEIQTIDGQQKDLVVIPNYFGALSEKAITYLQPVTNAQMLESNTKLDVPGSRVELILA